MVDDRRLHTMIGMTEETIKIADRHLATEVTVVTGTQIIGNQIISTKIAKEISTITQTAAIIVNGEHLIDKDKLHAGSARNLDITAITVISAIEQTIANMIVTTIDLTTGLSAPPIIVYVDFQMIETKLNFVPIMINNLALKILPILTLNNI